MISVVTWLWTGGRDFLPGYVDALARQVHEHMREIPHRFICVTDFPVRDFCELVEVVPMPAEARALKRFRNPAGERFPSSYPRLWTFSLQAREILGDRVLLVDADAMFVSTPARLLTVDADFVGWRVRSSPGMPKRFAGGTWMLRTGTRARVWEKFVENPQNAIDTAKCAGYVGSDQAWISYMLSETEAEWPEPSGIYRAQDWRKHWERTSAKHGREMQRRSRMPSWMQRAKPAPAAPRLTIPPDSVILHMNGEMKPWHADDEIVRKHFEAYTREPAC